jgi:sulfur relay (sulfurtransferase) complex TusBCD TusD component (DsrE family)
MVGGSLQPKPSTLSVGICAIKASSLASAKQDHSSSLFLLKECVLVSKRLMGPDIMLTRLYWQLARGVLC